jgi:hypothetical protein
MTTIIRSEHVHGWSVAGLGHGDLKDSCCSGARRTGDADDVTKGQGAVPVSPPVVRGVKSLPSFGKGNCKACGICPKRSNPGWSISPWTVKVRTVSSPRLTVIRGVQGVLETVPLSSEICDGPTDIANELPRLETVQVVPCSRRRRTRQ